MAKVRCTCRCHTPEGATIKHIVPCCQDGYRYTNEPEPIEGQIVTERGPIELMGIAYKHDDGNLTIVPIDDPYLGPLGRQTLLLLHQHICLEFERMKRTDPQPTPQGTAEASKKKLTTIDDDRHVRLTFGEKEGTYYEYFKVGNDKEVINRAQMAMYILSGGGVSKLTINGEDEPNIPKFIAIIMKYGQQEKPYMRDEFKPSSN